MERKCLYELIDSSNVECQTSQYVLVMVTDIVCVVLAGDARCTERLTRDALAGSAARVRSGMAGVKGGRGAAAGAVAAPSQWRA